MRRILLFTFCVLCTSVISAAPAEPPVAIESLKVLLGKFSALSGEFDQRVLNSHREILEQGIGRFAIMRPGRFIWEAHTPDPLVVVTNGLKVWQYDKVLKQVTVQSLEGQVSTPAVLLSGELHELDKLFDVEALVQGCEFEGQHCFMLKPKKQDDIVAWITLRFKNDRISQLRFSDQLGQTTMIDFKNVNVNPPLRPELFNFTPPRGVDVVGDAS